MFYPSYSLRSVSSRPPHRPACTAIELESTFSKANNGQRGLFTWAVRGPFFFKRAQPNQRIFFPVTGFPAHSSSVFFLSLSQSQRPRRPHAVRPLSIAGRESENGVGKMETVKSLLKPKPTPQQQLREWQRRLRNEGRNIDRQIRGEAARFSHSPGPDSPSPSVD